MSGKSTIGVDVSKQWLDLCCPDGVGDGIGQTKLERICNTAEAIEAWLGAAEPAVVALEPTGWYERALLTALRNRTIPFIRAHPNRLAAFRVSRGIAAKPTASTRPCLGLRRRDGGAARTALQLPRR